MSCVPRSSTARLAVARWIRRLSLGLGLAVAALAPVLAHAQPKIGATAVVDEGARAALFAERQRVRADLEQANAEIDALKRSGRGLRDDYRLRARMADAEALARRLTALDARLGGQSSLPSPAWPGAEPRALPTDGPAELEAKADILSDQARRLSERGDALLSRARDLRARQNLRRRVGQMERDPFSPLEGSKRRAMASSAALPPRDTATGGSTVGASSNPGPTFTSDSKGSGAPVAPAADSNTPPPGYTPGAVPTTTPSTPPRSVGSVPVPTTSPSGGLALSAQLRDLLDPATLAEVQRLEATGGASNGYEALERAAAALKARAQRLTEQAAAVRAKAR
jgi:hypothetical protein